MAIQHKLFPARDTGAKVSPLQALAVAASLTGLLCLLKARAFFAAPGWGPDTSKDLAMMLAFGAVMLVDIVLIAVLLRKRG